MPPSRAGRSRRVARPGRWPCAARRPSWRRSSARRSTRDPRAAASSSTSTSIATASSVNPMLTGRFQLAAPGEKPPSKTAVVLGVRPAARRGRRPTPPRGRTAPPGCRPTTRRSRSATATRPRWARSTCCRPASTAPCPGLGAGEMGPDADDPALTLEVWRERIRRHPGELKNLLRNQAFVAGIGNAYSDEILHAARLLPFRKRSTLAAEEVDALYAAMRSTLATRSTCCGGASRRRSRSRYGTSSPSTTRAAQACPRCGTRITEVKAGGFVDVVSAAAASAERAPVSEAGGPARPATCSDS